MVDAAAAEMGDEEKDEPNETDAEGLSTADALLAEEWKELKVWILGSRGRAVDRCKYPQGTSCTQSCDVNCG